MTQFTAKRVMTISKAKRAMTRLMVELEPIAYKEIVEMTPISSAEAMGKIL